MTIGSALLLAHSGGFSWDEALFVALPVLVLALLARKAKRVAAEEAAREAEEQERRPGPRGRPDSEDGSHEG